MHGQASIAPAAAGSQVEAGAAINVAVVDDSAVVRGLVARWIEEDPELNLCGRYSNGQYALDGFAKQAPDIAVLDIEMPVMDGMTVLPLLLEQNPGVKIIMASTLTQRNAEISVRAMALGAVDYVPKPETNRVASAEDFKSELIDKIKALGRTRLRRKARAARAAEPVKSAPCVKTAIGPKLDEISYRAFSPLVPKILTIGSSTGGPQILTALMGAIKRSIQQVPVVITQHMPKTFTAILADHLGRAAGCEAKEGVDGELLQPGRIYVAPGGQHMAVVTADGGKALKIYDGPDVNFCKPAVDPLFDSVAKEFGGSALAVVLTGMGHDGAKGAIKIADAGGSVIAQDEATSVVWGMPGATAAAGACAAVLPADQIGNKINTLILGGHS